MSDVKTDDGMAAKALVEMGVPGVVQIGDWACPLGHFNTLASTECSKCVSEGRNLNAKERYMVAFTNEGRRQLMDFVTQKELEQTLSRPSSTEMEREAAASQAMRPDEEILESRDEESDRGFPAPLNQDLTAEEQAMFYKLVLEKRKSQIREEPDLYPSASELEGSGSAGDAMSSERAEVLEDSGSDKMSFVTAMAGSASSVADRPVAAAGPERVGSRKERTKQRTAQHVEEQSKRGYSILPPVVH